jgi:hypothetical protein
MPVPLLSVLVILVPQPPFRFDHTRLELTTEFCCKPNLPKWILAEPTAPRDGLVLTAATSQPWSELGSPKSFTKKGSAPLQMQPQHNARRQHTAARPFSTLARQAYIWTTHNRGTQHHGASRCANARHLVKNPCAVIQANFKQRDRVSTPPVLCCAVLQHRVVLLHTDQRHMQGDD